MSDEVNTNTQFPYRERKKISLRDTRFTNIMAAIKDIGDWSKAWLSICWTLDWKKADIFPNLALLRNVQHDRPVRFLVARRVFSASSLSS